MIKENARDAKQIADELGITLILDCGSLLGAYRDKAPIKGDEDDLDFAVSYEVAEHKMLDLINAFSARGFELKRLRPTVMSFERGGNHVDLLFYQEDEVGNYYLTLYHDKKPHALHTFKEAYDFLGEIEFVGTKFACPRNIDLHLTHRYGNWRKPILRPNFSFKNYIERGVMIPIE